jgi:hypothetical protein
MSLFINQIRSTTDLEALGALSVNVAKLQSRLEFAEQKLNQTTEQIIRVEQRNTDLKTTISTSVTITTASVSFIALSVLALPLTVVAAGTGGAGYLAYKGISNYLTQK